MSIPILVMADIHGNLEALRAVLKDAGGDYEEIWVLGDIAGYGPDPGPCLDILTGLGAVMIAGNHDWAACGKIDTGTFNGEAKAAVEIHQQILTEHQKYVLERLPDTLIRRSVTLAHGNPLDPIWGYVLNDPAAEAVLRNAQTSLTVIGHTHLPAFWALEKDGIRRQPLEIGVRKSYAGVPHLANPGSVGQSRDGNPATRYMILDPIRKTLEFRSCNWRRGPLRRKMASRGYPPTLIQRMAGE